MTENEVAAEANGKEIKEETTSQPDEELENAIIHQVEYYFGDANLGRDKFLREQVKLDEGWVPLTIMIKFNRLAKLTTDLDVIADALNKSTSGLLEVSDDKSKVRRNPELPAPEMNEERRKELQGRTIYAKGFPKDSELDALLKYFNDFAEVETVIMRRYQDKTTKVKHFKGSVFTTFKAKESAEKFLSSKPKYGETELLVSWQEEYLKKKQEEYMEKKSKQEKKSKDKEAKAQEQSEAFKLPTGTVLLISGTSTTTKREDIKEAVEKLGTDAEVAYVDFKLGDTEGWVRMSKENAAKEIMDKITDGKMKIGDQEVTLKLVEGDEEKVYLQKTVDEMVKRRKNQRSFGKFNNKNRNQRGGRFGGKKRRQEQHDDAPPSKVKADAS